MAATAHMQAPTPLRTITPRTIAEMKRERDEKIAAGQQLFACIKKSSKYYGQGEPGALFPVHILATRGEDYPVQGGPGGQYRLSDVNLYAVADGAKLRIS